MNNTQKQKQNENENENENEIETITVAVVGHEYVGKTSFVEKLYDKTFDTDMTLATMSFNTRKIMVDKPDHLKKDGSENEKFAMELTDVSPMILPHMIDFVNQKDCVILMYDLSDVITFIQLEAMVKMIKERPCNNKLIYLIGNKCDREGKDGATVVTHEDVIQFMLRNDIKGFCKLQSKDYDSLKCSFDTFARSIFKMVKQVKIDIANNGEVVFKKSNIETDIVIGETIGDISDGSCCVIS